MKIIINGCYGGFSISEKALFRYAELKGITLYPEKGSWGTTVYWTIPPEERPVEPIGNWLSQPPADRTAYNKAYNNHTFSERPEDRTDPLLIQVVEELGAEANGRCASLKIVEIPDDVKWQIEEYDGIEWIAEEHRTWS